MENIKAYYIEDSYINYLSQYDKKVPFNKQQTRPYIGVVIKRNNLDYFAPLSSPKEKHKLMKSGLDVFKIKGGDLGIINLNNMIPVSRNNIIKIDLDKKPVSYKNLINGQIQFINNHKQELFKKVDKLFKLYENNSIQSLTNRCCNFPLLEKKCVEYNEINEYIKASQEVASSNFTPEVSIKNRIISMYKNEFPDINFISEKAAQRIFDFNKSKKYDFSIREIRIEYEKAGKNLENSDTSINRKAFKELDEINSEIKECKSKARQNQQSNDRALHINKANIPEL